MYVCICVCKSCYHPFLYPYPTTTYHTPHHTPYPHPNQASCIWGTPPCPLSATLPTTTHSTRSRRRLYRVTPPYPFSSTRLGLKVPCARK